MEAGTWTEAEADEAAAKVVHEVAVLLADIEQATPLVLGWTEGKLHQTMAVDFAKWAAMAFGDGSKQEGVGKTTAIYVQDRIRNAKNRNQLSQAKLNWVEANALQKTYVAFGNYQRASYWYDKAEEAKSGISGSGPGGKNPVPKPGGKNPVPSPLPTEASGGAIGGTLLAGLGLLALLILTMRPGDGGKASPRKRKGGR